MSECKQRSDVEIHVAEGPFVDDAERAESEWLLAQESGASVPAPSSRTSKDYAELEDLLATLPTGASDDSWHDRVLTAARRRRTVTRWVVGGALVAAAAVVVWALLPRTPAAELEVVIRHTPRTTARSSDIVVGDRLVVTARAHGPGQLRVYRSDGLLFARCPDGRGCQSAMHGEYIIDITFDAPLRYQVIFVVGNVDAPLGGTMDTYLAAVGAAQAHVVLYPSIDVH